MKTIWDLSAERIGELLRMSAAERLNVRQPREGWMDAFCTRCGAFIAGDGYAIGKYFCSTCARLEGCDCSGCGCDGGSGAGGYSNCCGAPMGTAE